MEYKYRKNQIFGKRLKVPKSVLNLIYKCNLNLVDYIKFDLTDKIPLSCLDEFSRIVVEKYGIEKIKTLDFEVLSRFKYKVSFEKIFESIPSDAKDINAEIYNILKSEIQPALYPENMKKSCTDCYFDLENMDNDDPNHSIMMDYNYGYLRLEKIILNWDILKDKDLSYFLKQKNINIEQGTLKKLINKYEKIFKLILEKESIDIITEFLMLESEEQRNEYISNVVKDILHAPNKYKYSPLTNEEYKELFKYTSLKEYVSEINEAAVEPLFEELSNKPADYIFDIPIPFNKLMNDQVLKFVKIYGLDNIVEFDKESGNFFTNDNCEMLKNMYMMYLHYGNKTFYKDENDSKKTYTKDEFYEAMRNIIIFGHTDWDYSIYDLRVRNISGEFKEKNIDLFISEDAPEELQNAFYSKSITPDLISDNPEYIKYLKEKNIQSCFAKKRIIIKSEDGSRISENIYKFLSDKVGVEKALDFIVEYSDILNLIYKSFVYSSYAGELDVPESIQFEQFENKLTKLFKKIIIDYREAVPEKIPEKVKKFCPTIFLDENAPKELKNIFYSRNMKPSVLRKHPEYEKYLIDKEPNLIFDVEVTVMGTYPRVEHNFSSLFVQQYGSDEFFKLLKTYGTVIEDISNRQEFGTFDKLLYVPLDEFYNELDKFIYEKICSGVCKYDNTISKHFKNNYPSLFLNDNVPNIIQEKFYSRTLTLDDLNNNPEWLIYFENTNIACGFSEEVAWIIPIFNNMGNVKKENYGRMKIITEYLSIEDIALRNIFKDCIIELGEDIDLEKIKYAQETLSRLERTNSSEMFVFRKELAKQLLKTDNPIENLDKIEAVFVKNNIPTVGKIYSCFEILHPNFEGFIYEVDPSPVLMNSSNITKKTIVFTDLIKASFGSNNRSVNDYLKNIENGYKIYELIKTDKIKLKDLKPEQQNEIITFSKHLITLYNNTIKGKNEPFKQTENVISNIFELSKLLSPNGTLDYNLADRVVSMFCHYAGIDTLEEAKEYVNSKINLAETRNISASQTNMNLEQGDYIKGIGDITYLRNILQNGSVSKEYLGASAGSDRTPLDTDISMIVKSDGTIQEKINATAAKSYGPIWFVLKNDDRFITTRTQEGLTNIKNDMSKLEAFYTGVLDRGHYGIRTGFASSEINYMVMKEFDSRVGLEIAMNGFYIPVANTEGKIIFTYEDYKKIREKMSGLSYYDENNYEFSENLVNEETKNISTLIENSNSEIIEKQKKINEIIKESLAEVDLKLKTTIDGDLTEGFVELIDTGSTGRGTNLPGDGDFDYMMRIDKTIISNPHKLEQLKKVLLKNFGIENKNEITNTGDFRFKNVQIDEETIVDIDITFTEKTDKISYSTDMSLQDRLSTIKKIDEEKYKYVIANIIKAKQYLKKHEVYKPNRGEIPQGGLGGVGVENWILQNGGSFEDAARNFIEASKDKTFEEFKKSYSVWDFGENHLAVKKDKYVHDDFVYCNMSEIGYEKMKKALILYLNNLEYENEYKISQK